MAFSPNWLFTGLFLGLLVTFIVITSDDYTIDHRPLPGDSNSLSSYNISRPVSYSLDLSVFFNSKIISGTTEISFMGRVNESFVDLDIKSLNIHSVKDEKGNSLTYQIKSIPSIAETTGQQLHIQLAAPLTKERRYTITITHSTEEFNSGLHWVDAKDTQTKKPLVYFFAYPNLARNLFPCLDSPRAPTVTYDAIIRVPKGNKAYFAGQKAGPGPSDPQTDSFKFESLSQEVGLHSLAFVVGNLQEKRIGDRITFVAEQISDDHAEQLNKTESFLSWSEAFYEDYYTWSMVFHIVMPRSFPWNVIQTPGLLLIHPSMLTKESSRINDIALRTAYLWNCDLVSPANWGNLWMSEAFSRYLQRTYLEFVSGNNESSLIEANIGYNRMVREILRAGFDFSNLEPDTSNKFPLDAAIPIIHGEKGYHILLRLANITEPGFLPDFAHLWVYGFKSERVWLHDIMHHFQDTLQYHYDYPHAWVIKNKIRIDIAAHEVGIPHSEIEFRSPLLDEITQIVQDYIKAGGASSPANFARVKQYNNKAQLAFFEQFLVQAQQLNTQLISRLEMDYRDILSGDYDEIKSTWFQLCVRWTYSSATSKIAEFVASTGVLEQIRPIYRAFKDSGKPDYAKSLLESHVEFYHPLVYSLIEKDLSNQKNFESDARIHKLFVMLPERRGRLMSIQKIKKQKSHR
eukprot:TRINITY_DN3895_c0_g1_i1.p1 TRINITY_DN3895_c0_g1~~TRINITY_DN3895_c0_g1_i1.p1  ORF type:complete len:686 (+),score=187.02 TRINITY_DN3895_c0_g1_i1:163-2220(+)